MSTVSPRRNKSFASLTPSPQKVHTTSDPLLLEMEVNDLTERVERLEKYVEEVETLRNTQSNILASQTLIFKQLASIESAGSKECCAKCAPSTSHYCTPQRYPSVSPQTHSSFLPTAIPMSSSSFLAAVPVPDQQNKTGSELTTASASQSRPFPPPNSPQSPVCLSDESPGHFPTSHHQLVHMFC